MIRLLMTLLRRVRRRQWQTIGRMAVLTAAIAAYATSGFMYFELAEKPDLRWGDALWWAVVTMTTVGYGDLFPTTLGGRYLIGFPTMLFGISVLGYLLSVVASYLIEARGKELRGMGRTRFEDHMLIINYPGETRLAAVLDQLGEDERTRQRPVVLVDDRLAELPARFAERGVRFISGNPSVDETLERARFREAAFALILARDARDSASDDRSLAAALTLEKLHAALVTTVECVDPNHATLFERAGVDNVVCLDQVSTNLLVSETLEAGVVGVVTEITSASFGQQLYVVDIEDLAEWTFAGLQRAFADESVMVLGVRRGDETRLNPPPDTPVEANDRAVCLAAKRPSTRRGGES